MVRVRVSSKVVRLLSLTRDYMNGGLGNVEIFYGDILDLFDPRTSKGNGSMIRVSKEARQLAFECNTVIYGGSSTMTELINNAILAQCKTVLSKSPSRKRRKKINNYNIATIGIISHCRRIIAYHNRESGIDTR